MNNTPSALEQKSRIEEATYRLISSECYMVAKAWWDSWLSYVNFSSTTSSPGPINNTPLLELTALYKALLDDNSFCSPNLSHFTDWSYMSLKKGLTENVDYVLVNQAAWLQLSSWYKGGPTIRICVVGHESSNGVFKAGRPDLNPVTLIFEKPNIAGIPERYGIIFSLQATGAQLCQYLAQLSNTNPSKMRVQCRVATEQFWIESNEKTLEEYGVKAGASITAFEPINGRPPTVIKQYEEEKNSLFREEMLKDDEEMLRLAIEASLKEIARPFEEEKLAAGPRIPSIQIRDTETDPDEPERPKTPSTGESTPTRRFRRQLQALNIPPNNYQLLAKHIERQRGTNDRVEQKREFEEKLELATEVLTGPRIKLKQKSQTAILQALLKLEEETVAIAEEDKKKSKLRCKGKRIVEDL